MKKMIIIFTLIIIVIATLASVIGVFSYTDMSFEKFTTARGEQVEIMKSGIYKYNVKALVIGGIPFDLVRLIFGIPLLIFSFILFLRNSFKGTLLFIGVIASFLYQYFLWTFDWAFNQLYLVYVSIFSLSMIVLLLIFIKIDIKECKNAFLDKFPVKTLSIFSFALGGMLLLKCLGEIIPTIFTRNLPSSMTGYYTIIDQGMDIGIMFPFSIIVGILLLKRNIYGFLLSTISLVIFINLGLSIITGGVVDGFVSGNMPIPGIVIFSFFMIIDAMILIVAFKNIKKLKLII